MKCRSRPLLAIAAGLFLGGCALLPGGGKSKKTPVPPAREPQLVGTVSLVNLEGKFGLIDSEGRPSPAAGSMLISAPGSAMPWELRVSEIRRRPFVVGDFSKGSPVKGDQAFLLPPPAAP